MPTSLARTPSASFPNAEDSLFARNQFRTLSKRLRESCRSGVPRDIEYVMRSANDAFDGHGVERAAYEVPRRDGGTDRVVDFFYVNRRNDGRNMTLIADLRKLRYRLSTLNDEVEAAERRYGDRGEWRQ